MRATPTTFVLDRRGRVLKQILGEPEWSELHALLVNRYYMDHLYQAIVDRVVLGAGSVIAWVDKRIVNETGVDGGAQTVNYFGYRLKFLQTGKIPNYVLAMAVGVIGLAVLALAG